MEIRVNHIIETDLGRVPIPQHKPTKLNPPVDTVRQFIIQSMFAEAQSNARNLGANLTNTGSKLGNIDLKELVKKPRAQLTMSNPQIQALYTVNKIGAQYIEDGRNNAKWIVEAEKASLLGNQNKPDFLGHPIFFSLRESHYRNRVEKLLNQPFNKTP